MRKKVRPGSVITIDCDYLMPRFAAAYLIIEGDRAVFVENNTTHAVPILMQALRARGLSPEQVDYAIITHLHLDHAGGTSALLKRCANAVVVAHPRASRHLADPSRLVAGARAVYGEEEFKRLYGTIEPVDAGRVRTVEDGERLEFGDRQFTFMHTLGHAKHHICVCDSGSNGVFTGDAFGLILPTLQRGAQPFAVCSSAPVGFDPEEARKSVRRILATGAERVYPTHFGEVERVNEAAEQVLWSIDSMDAILNEVVAAGLEEEELLSFCEERVRDSFAEQAQKCGMELRDADRQVLERDAFLNAGGIAHAARIKASRTG